MTGCGGAAAGEDGPIRIGMALAQSGYLAGNDRPMVEGARTAVAQINREGGIDGRPLELEIQDIASSPSKAVTITNRMLFQRHVGAFANGFLSAATEAESAILRPREVPMVVASVLPKNPDWTFTTYPKIAYFGEAQLGAAKAQGARRVAILYAQNPYGQATGALMAKQARALGMQVVDSQGIDTTKTTLAAQLSRVRQRGAEAIVDALVGPVHIALARDARTVGLKIPVIMGVDNLDVYRQSARIYPRVQFLATPPQTYPDVADPQRKAANATFLRALDARLGPDNGVDVGYASRAYDAITLLAKAMRTSGATTGPRLRDAIARTTIEGTTARYALSPDDHSGMRENPVVVARFEGDRVKVIHRP
nr:ABC transporter substrate-binding protein [Patulibacter sp. SYSU D01012]